MSLRDASGRTVSNREPRFSGTTAPHKVVAIPMKLRSFFSALSQSVDDCTATVQIVGTSQAPNQIDIPLGTVCVECVVNGEVDTSTTTFLIGNSPIPLSQGTLMGGVLVVCDTSVAFQASPALTLRYVSDSDVRQASVYWDGMSPKFV